MTVALEFSTTSIIPSRPFLGAAAAEDRTRQGSAKERTEGGSSICLSTIQYRMHVAEFNFGVLLPRFELEVGEAEVAFVLLRQDANQ